MPRRAPRLRSLGLSPSSGLLHIHISYSSDQTSPTFLCFSLSSPGLELDNRVSFSSDAVFFFPRRPHKYVITGQDQNGTLA